MQESRGPVRFQRHPVVSLQYAWRRNRVPTSEGFGHQVKVFVKIVF